MDSSRYVSDSQLFYIHFIGFLFKKKYICIYILVYLCASHIELFILIMIWKNINPFQIEKYAQENQDTKHIFGQIRHMLIIRWKRIHHHLNKFLRWFRIVPKRPSKYSNIERTESQVCVILNNFNAH